MATLIGIEVPEAVVGLTEDSQRGKLRIIRIRYVIERPLSRIEGAFEGADRLSQLESRRVSVSI